MAEDSAHRHPTEEMVIIRRSGLSVEFQVDLAEALSVTEGTPISLGFSSVDTGNAGFVLVILSKLSMHQVMMVGNTAFVVRVRLIS